MSDSNATHRWIKENVEAVAIAIVMALVIRQFAVEAFKIPTESMAPTLLGDKLGGGTGDRILVDKIPIMFGEPDRWSVIVFKYPLNESKNYIKRLVGLSGETLSVRDGDVIIDGKVSRKPPHVQEVLFFPVYPGVLTDEEIARAWQTDDGDPWRRLDDGGFEVEADGPAFMSFFRDVRDVRPWQDTGGANPVGDVRLRANVTAGAKGGVVVLRIVDLRVENDLVLAVGEGKSFLRHGSEEIPLPDVVLEPGEETEVSFANVDDTLVAIVDGDEFRHEYEPVATEDFDHSEDAIRFGVERGSARFTDLKLDRDEYYTNQGYSYRDVHIPEGHYFVLGDNSLSSADSREWRKVVFELKDGRTFAHDDRREEDLSTRPEDVPPGSEVFQDLHGIWRVIPKSEIRRRHTEPAPFVPRENLIGRAFFVFWPMPPVSKHFRLKFIR